MIDLKLLRALDEVGIAGAVAGANLHFQKLILQVRRIKLVARGNRGDGVLELPLERFGDGLAAETFHIFGIALEDGLRSIERFRRVPDLDVEIELLVACFHVRGISADELSPQAERFAQIAMIGFLDGFTRGLPGLRSASGFARLEAALAARYGAEAAGLIASGNALRVLRTGWGQRVV